MRKIHPSEKRMDLNLVTMYDFVWECLCVESKESIAVIWSNCEINFEEPSKGSCVDIHRPSPYKALVKAWLEDTMTLCGCPPDFV